MNKTGSAILQKYGSLNTAITIPLSGFELAPWKFGYSGDFWKFPSNHTVFLENIKNNKSIHNPYEWKRVTHSEIIKQSGGPLLKIYGSLRKMLWRGYIPYKSNRSHISVAQRQLEQLLTQLNITSDWKMNWKPHKFLHSSGRPMEFDFFSPHLKIAVKYIRRATLFSNLQRSFTGSKIER